MSEYQRAYYEANKERLKEAARKRYYENRDIRLQQARDYQKNNREAHNAACARWRAAHPEKAAEVQQRRRARVRGASVGVALNLAELIVFYGPYCMVPNCTRQDLTVDHVVPLSLGGPHEASNQQILCTMHNSQKSNRSCADYRPFKVVDILV